MRTRYNDPHGLNPEDGSGGVEELEPVVVVGKRRSNYELYLERLRYGRQNGEDGPKFFDTDGENLRARINWVHEYHSRRREMNEDVGTAVVTIVTTAIPLGNLVKLKFLGKALQPLFVKFGNKSSIIIEGLLKRYAAKGGHTIIPRSVGAAPKGFSTVL